MRKFLFVLYIIAVCVLCFADAPDMPEVDKFILGIPMDKIAHFLMFAPFPFLAHLAFGRSGGNANYRVRFALLTFLAGEVFALATETVQYFLPTRTMELADFLADTIGIALCTVAMAIFFYLRRK